jgi:AMMECR1 domain-containing protein
MLELIVVGPRLPEVARKAIFGWLQGGGLGTFAAAGPPSAVFVTLRDERTPLRGCDGVVSPVRPDVVNETARCAVLAATQDPRFPPVSLSELDALTIEVSVLGEEEPAEFEALDPRTYGLVVRDDFGRRGVLLPGIDGIDDAETQVRLARRKAGIDGRTPVQLSRFRVTKWVEGVSEPIRAFRD